MARNSLDVRNWPLGHLTVAIVRGERIKGQAVARVDRQRIRLRLHNGQYLECGTHMLAAPTGLVWPYENDDVHRVMPGSSDLTEVKAQRRGMTPPAFKPWIKPKEKPISELPVAEAEKLDKRERARQRRLARKARGGR